MKILKSLALMVLACTVNGLWAMDHWQLVNTLPDLQARLGKRAFENPTGPDNRWSEMKQEYDQALQQFNEHPETLAESQSRDQSIAEYLNLMLSSLRSPRYGGWARNLLERDLSSNDYTDAAFEILAKNAIKLINDNKKSLTERADKGTEYYQFARTYVNQINQAIASVCKSHEPLAHHVSYQHKITVLRKTMQELIDEAASPL